MKQNRQLSIMLANNEIVQDIVNVSSLNIRKT